MDLKEKKIKEFQRLHKVKLEGYAGILPNGNIVDRREYPDAIPMLKNSFLGIPEPKEIIKK